VAQGRFAEYLDMRANTIAPVAKGLNAALDALLVSEEKAAEQTVAAAKDTYESARTTILAVLVIGLLAAVALGLLVARMVIRPVTAVRDGWSRWRPVT
jgi:methyl-accepting chemotaxis protein